MPPKVEAAVAIASAVLLAVAGLAFRVAVAAALVVLILGWAAAGACRRTLLPSAAAEPSAAGPAR